LNVHKGNDVRRHIAELLSPNPNPFQAEIAIAKLKKYKSTGSDNIPEERIEAGGKTKCLRSTNSFIQFG
jgi:hypothetical protein